MQSNHHQLFLQTAVTAVRQAGQLALGMQGSLKNVRLKGVKDIITEADLACDASIRTLLEAAHPDHDIVTEEAPALRKGGEWTWYVDPIDGTVNYSRGLPLWGVSVGLLQTGADGARSMIAGAVYLPSLNELYTSRRGGGAHLNGKAIHVSAVDKLEDAVISHGDFNVGEIEERNAMNRRNLSARMHTASAVQRVKCMGSAVVEGAWVAAGRMEAYCMLAMKPWDVSVTSLLVAEAGGKVTRVNGEPFDVEGADALFSNGILQGPLLELLRE